MASSTRNPKRSRIHTFAGLMLDFDHNPGARAPNQKDFHRDLRRDKANMFTGLAEMSEWSSAFAAIYATARRQQGA